MLLTDQDMDRAEEFADKNYSRTDKRWMPMYRAYFQACRDNNEEMEREAIEFVNWILSNGWFSINDEKYQWQRHVSSSREYKTTSELYQLYKQQKP